MIRSTKIKIIVAVVVLCVVIGLAVGLSLGLKKKSGSTTSIINQQIWTLVEEMNKKKIEYLSRYNSRVVNFNNTVAAGGSIENLSIEASQDYQEIYYKTGIFKDNINNIINSNDYPKNNNNFVTFAQKIRQFIQNYFNVDIKIYQTRMSMMRGLSDLEVYNFYSTGTKNILDLLETVYQDTKLLI